MPWFFTIPEFLKKRACRYLLQHYLGQFLEEKISLEDLTVDLYNGTGSIHNVPLNVEAINEVLSETGAPVKVVSGYLGCVTVSVPWTALLKDSCKVEVSELTLCVAPDLQHSVGEEAGSMTDSLFFGMTSSMQLAEEVLKSGPTPGEEEAASTGFEGMEALARAIELVLNRVQISLTDAMVQINYRTADQTQEYFLKARINSIEFFDELSKTESSVDGESEPTAQPLPNFSVKVLQLSGLTLEVGSSPLESVRLDQSVDESINSSLLSPQLSGVPIATAGGQLSVRVKIKQNENEPGPKLEVEAFLGSLHLLLSPQQLSILTDMATGIASQGGSGSTGTFEKLNTGQSRPIPKSDMKTIESQLAKHQLREQKLKAKLQQREDLFHADPWNNSLANPRSLADSTHSSSDEFFSLDLTTSYAESTSATIQSVSLEDSYLSTDSKLSSATPPPGIHTRYGVTDTVNIPLHSGVGLQQLSQNAGLSHANKGQRSPTTRRSRTVSGEAEHPPRAANHQTDMCKYSVTVGGVTIALLESQPLYTYTPGIDSSVWATRPSLSPNSLVEETSPYCSIDEGGLDPLKYFETVCKLLADGVSRKELESKEEELAQVLPNDHLLLWLSTVKCSIMSGGPAVDLDLSVASAELWEYLYRNQAKLNTITKPLSVSPIVQLFEDSSLSPPLPCFKLKLSSATPTSGKSKKKSRDLCSEQLTTVDAQLATIHFNGDVTLLDRLQPLLSASSRTSHFPLKTSSLEKVKQSLYMTTSNFHTINQQRQAVFNQAVSTESSTSKDHKLNIKIKVSTLNLSLRFPIPDLKDTKKPPWYLPSLRNEVLFLSVSDVRLTSQLRPSALARDALYWMDIKFDSTKAYLSCDGSVKGRELFLTISSSRHLTSPSLTECSHVRLVVQPVSDSALERGGKKGRPDALSHCDSFELGSEVNEPTPFSSRKTMFSSGKSPEKGADGGRYEEQVLPGSPQEMEEFESHAKDSAHYSLTCSLPQVKVHLPSSKFLGILYNRFATDLALWEPATPSAVEKANAKSVMISCMDVLQPAATSEDRFEMCKSVLKEEDSDDESTVEGTYTAPTLDHTHRQSSVDKGLSSLAVSLNIDEGIISMLTQGDKAQSEEVKEPCSHEDVDSSLFHSAQSVDQLLDLSPRQTTPLDHSPDDCGLALLQASGLHMFSVLGYKGDTGHDYFCAQINDFSLRHAGTLHMETYSCVEDPLSNHSVLATLLPVVYPSSPPSPSKPHPPTGYEQRNPMVAVAIEMRFDKERNSKTNKCSIALTNTTVQYYVSSPQHNCFTQLGDFFTLTDDEVPGYEPPSVITELHTHINSCSLEYKPLHLPLHMLLCLDSVSLSTSLVTGAPVLVLRLVTDGVYLLLAHEQYEHPDPKQGFVCVLEMEWFELTVRLCDNTQLGEEYHQLFARLPDISVECSSNVVHLRTCADSCIALRDLLVYLATNGDLQAPQAAKEGGLRDYSSLGHEFSSLSSQGSPPSNSGSPLTSLTDTADIGDLISDAMEDQPPSPSPRRHTARSERKSSRKHKSNEAKLEIRVESNKSVVLDFCSDSSDDEASGVRNGAREGGGGVRGGSKERLLSPPPASKLSASEHSSIFSESDDDFCFVDTPTSTRVSPGHKPQMKSLLEDGETVELIEDHFSLPDAHTDQLQRPKHFPEPVSQFTLKEMTIIWHLYGGTDFSSPTHSTPPHKHTPPSQRARSGSNDWKQSASPVFQRKYSSSPGSDFIKVPAMGGVPRGLDWKSLGGPGRQHDVLVEVELDKLRFQHEKFPSDTEQSSRVVVLINELEIRDRLKQSGINKLLYQYTTESMPRQSHAHMLSLKVLFTRPELESDQSIEEAAVRLSVLPLRLNIDQDTVLFLYEFIKQVGSTAAVVVSSPDHSGGTVVTAPSPSTERRESGNEIPDSAATPLSSGNQEVFIRSFIFQPDLPIRIDYEAKRFKTEMGTLAGILLGLGHLNTSEVRLKALTYKKGLLGWDKLLEYVSNEWAVDIKAYQLPLILKGVGPMHHVTQLVHGMVDLVWLPYQQYQEDGRIMWGLQRGATAFTSSTGVALVELSSRVLESVQSFAQMAYDMVTPTECPSQALVHQHKPHQPLDFREGFANAYDVVSAGIGGTARDMYSAAAREHEERGMTGAVGGVLRQIPGTIVKPIILASEATRHVLGGVKNQFVPDARKEASKKWKSSETPEQC